MERSEFESQAVAHLDYLYRFARFLTRDADEAEELVQEVYMRAFRPDSIESFTDRGGGMRAWLSTIARSLFYQRLSRDRVRQRTRDAYAAQLASDGDVECADPSELAGVDWSDTEDCIGPLLDTLSPDHREVLWLWAVEGLKYREIAAAQDVPIGTVMSRLHRARSQAARFLAASLNAKSTDTAEAAPHRVAAGLAKG